MTLALFFKDSPSSWYCHECERFAVVADLDNDGYMEDYECPSCSALRPEEVSCNKQPR